MKIRYINVLDLFKLRSDASYGLSDDEFDGYFTTDKPVLFAFHGYEPMIESIFFKRHNHNLKVHGYREVGDITTHTPLQEMTDKLDEHVAYTRSMGTDLPEVEDWRWKALK